MIGKTISHYRIFEKLGGGGMGIVYRAEDTKLKRTVALKFLPPELTRDAEAKKRFIREAQAASALEHPNICNIHEIDETNDGQMYIVMACYEGETLKQKIVGSAPHGKGQRLSIAAAVDFAIQIARGLACAHEKDIIHRDIKPANIFITHRNEVKILDFGIAKLAGQTQLTRDTSTPGTVAYMSPEQCRGEKVDHQTDIWSLGVILYQLLGGQSPYQGEYEQAVIYAILNAIPKRLTKLNPEVPAELERIVSKAMSKDPSKRYQHADEFVDDLTAFKNVPTSRTAINKRNIYKRSAGIISVVLIFIIFALIYFFSDSGKPEAFSIKHTSPLTTAPGLEQDPAWSPDGTRIAYASDNNGNMDIWIRQIAAGQNINLTKDHDGYDGQPVWSPDGEWIAFVSDRQGGGIFRISALGGIPKQVVSLTFSPTLSYIGAIPTVCWSPDGRELAYANAGSLYTVSSGGGTPVYITLPPKGLIIGYAEPAWSPEGDRLVCTGFVGPGIATSQVWSVKGDGTDPVEVTSGMNYDKNPIWAADNQSIFFISDRGGINDIWWIPVDLRGSPTGKAEALTAGVGVGKFALSKDGSRLAYAKIIESVNIWSLPVIPDCTLAINQARRITAENNYIESVICSPDGEWLAFDSNRSGNMDIWIMRKDGSQLRQITTHRAHDWAPSWSPDGKKLVFHSFRNGNRDLFIVPAAGGAVTAITNHPEQDFLPRWAPGGSKIAFFSSRSGNLDIWVIPDIGEKPVQLTFHAAQDNTSLWSPDGNTIAFGSTRSGTGEIYLVPAEGGDVYQLTHAGWTNASPYYWSADGKTIYAYGKGGPGTPGSNYWIVTLQTGSVKPLLDLKGSIMEPFISITGDGERFYFPLWECTGDLWLASLYSDR